MEKGLKFNLLQHLQEETNHIKHFLLGKGANARRHTYTIIYRTEDLYARGSGAGFGNANGKVAVWQ